MSYTGRIFKLAAKFEKLATTFSEEVVSNMDLMIDHITVKANEIFADHGLPAELTWSLKEIDPEDLSEDEMQRDYRISCHHLSEKVYDVADTIEALVKPYLKAKEKEGLIDYFLFDIDIMRDRKGNAFTIKVVLTKYLT